MPVSTRSKEPVVEAFTRAPMNRKLQSLFVAFFVVPQVAVYLTSKDLSAYHDLASMFAPAFRLSAWQRWLQTEAFLLVLACLAFERMVYSIVWLFPAHFKHFAEFSPMRKLGQPLNVIVALFYVSKVFQLGAIFGFYLSLGPFWPAVQGLSLLRVVTGTQCFVVGQLLNAAIYRAIGKAGVYYGYKIGVPVPWCMGFPFNVFTMHPQYAGVVLSLLGGGILMCTPVHAEGGWVGVGIAQALYYLYMAIIEDMPAESPVDKRLQLSDQGEVRLRDLRKLKWSSPKSKEFHTSAVLLGFMARPWFPMLLAAVAFGNGFLLVLPVNLLFVAICFRNSYSVLPAAVTFAGGVAMAVALLSWAVESSCPTGCKAAGDSILGLAMSAGEIRAHWPIALEYVSQHGLLGSLAAFFFAHPMPVACFTLWAGHSPAPLILLAFFATALQLCLVGAAAVGVAAVAAAAYRRLFADYDPTPPPPPPAAAAPAAPPKRAAKSPARAAKSPARAASPRRPSRTPSKKAQ